MENIIEVSLEKYTVIKGNLSAVCRCCLSSDRLAEIFTDGTDMNQELVELLEPGYIPVESGDELPNFLCQKCLEIIRTWHRFRLQCEENFRLLKDNEGSVSKDVVNFEPELHASGLIVEDVKIEHIYMEEQLGDVEPQDQINAHLTKNEIDIDETIKQEEPPEEESFLEEDQIIKSKKTSKRHISKQPAYLRQCPICGLILKRGLQEHIMAHNDPTGRPFKCEICEKTYCRKENLKLHRQREHMKIRYPCEVCGKHFSTKDILSVHRKLHNSDVRYDCDQCGAEFKSNKYLYKHKQKHRGVKKFICSHCGKSFLVGEYLKDHIRIHTGERPFECKSCGKSFRTANHLRQHARIHANNAN
ncbi:zinc finger protein 225-like [Uranotaenia lowii]|uniref:zinc finger protein 225-like n=1 Tax=Uranotaenia lowii TaxID=190385 RepID=UPI00247A538F|nr:zinc finger protein 225-like [Uranotaenia lowii]